jgi:DNA-binding transcriptional LysR family regulator
MASDLRRLAYFVTISDLGSLARAADVLHVAQSALTRQLRLLEAELGLPLMVRSAKGVRLTPAGYSYYQSARALLGDHAAAKQKALHAASGDAGLLRIGTSDMYPWHPLFTSALRAYRSQSAGVAFSIEAVHSGEAGERILAERLDMALAYVGPQVSDALLEVSTWIHEGLILAVPEDSPLLAQPPRRLAELQDQDFVAFPRAQSPHLFELLTRHLRQRGCEPRSVHVGQTPNTVLGLVAAGLGFSIVPMSLGNYLPPGVAALPVPDLDLKVPISIVRRADNPSPILARFVGLLKGQETAGPGGTSGLARRAECRRFKGRGLGRPRLQARCGHTTGGAGILCAGGCQRRCGACRRLRVISQRRFSPDPA